jgi:hypothetical protein
MISLGIRGFKVVIILIMNIMCVVDLSEYDLGSLTRFSFTLHLFIYEVKHITILLKVHIHIDGISEKHYLLIRLSGIVIILIVLFLS